MHISNHTRADYNVYELRDTSMSTKLNIDEELLAEALRLGGKKSESETVNEALQEYVNRRKQKVILSLFGKVDFDPSYDYKKARQLR